MVWIDPLGLIGNRANRRASDILDRMDRSGGGHAYSRHGAGTTIQDQQNRALTGIPPDNPCPKKSKPIDSTRFLRYIDQLDAIQKGVALMNKNGTNIETFDMGRIVGEGFKANSCVRLTTSRVTVVRSQNGSIITAYPKL